MDLRKISLDEESIPSTLLLSFLVSVSSGILAIQDAHSLSPCFLRANEKQKRE